MWKMAAAVLAVLGVAGTTIVQAQRFGGDGVSPIPGRHPGAMREFGRFRLSPDDIAAFTDARIAAIRTGLRLSPEQEKNWPAFEEAYRNFAKLRADRYLAMREQAPPPPSGDIMDRLQQRADAISRRANAYKQLADTATPLYRSLDDGQKRRFAMLTRVLRPGEGGDSFRRRWQRPGHFQRDGSGELQRGGFEQGETPRSGGDLERIRYQSLVPEQR